jgi:predicted nucleotidyltransferase component of viral defense system
MERARENFGRPDRVAASIRDRLKNAAKARGGEPNASHLFVQRRFAFERLLARIARSGIGDRCMLKGGVLMLALDPAIPRATQDLDLTVRTGGPQGLQAIRAALEEACATVPEHDDGLEFVIDGKIALIREASHTSTVRAKVSATLRCGDVPRKDVIIRFQLDVTPAELDHLPVSREVPPILPDFPPTQFPSYPWEVVLAEKLHAIVVGTIANNRLRDWADVIKLADSGIIDEDAAADAIRRVFERRGASHRLDDTEPVGLSDAFASQRQGDWVTTMNTTGYGATMPRELADAVASVRAFCLPLMAAASAMDHKNAVVPMP